MPIEPCTCCCCCKICSWCLPETVYISIINVSVPECSSGNLPNNCQCNGLQDLLEAQVDIPVNTVPQSIAGGEVNADNHLGICHIWEFDYLGLGINTEQFFKCSSFDLPCDTGDDLEPPVNKFGAGRTWCCDCTGGPILTRSIDMNCQCNLNDGECDPFFSECATLGVRGFSPVWSVLNPNVQEGFNWSYFCIKPGAKPPIPPELLAYGWDPERELPSGLNIGLLANYIFEPPILQNKLCCWEYNSEECGFPMPFPLPRFGIWFSTFFDSNELITSPGGCKFRNATWSTDGPVCDENGHFVSQTWSVETPGGIEFDVVVYA